jgi:hypothetical protein
MQIILPIKSKKLRDKILKKQNLLAQKNNMMNPVGDQKILSSLALLLD